MSLFNRRRGFALVLSLFLVMFLFTGMTIMVANLRSDTRMSQQAFETAQYRFAAQGAVNKLHTLLKNGRTPDEFTADSPLEVSIGEFEQVKAWVIEDEATGVYHLRSEWQGAAYSKVVTQKKDGGALIYTNDGGVLKVAGPDDTSWTALPDPPPKAYSVSGGVEVDCSDLEISTRYFRANQDGQVAACFTGSNAEAEAIYLWDEGTQSWGSVPPAPGWRTVGNEVEPGGPPTVRNYVTLGEKTLFAYDNLSRPAGSPVSVVSYYNLETGTWADIKGPFGGARLIDGYMGPDDTFVAEVEYGGSIRAMQLTNGAWSEIATLPNGATLEKVRANGPNGELYATSTAGELFKRDEGEWSSVTVPTDSNGASLGKLESVDATGALIFHSDTLGQTQRWDQTSDPKELPEIAQFLGISGGGTDEEVVVQGFETTATY
jgi:hypothetical protein